MWMRRHVRKLHQARFENSDSKLLLLLLQRLCLVGSGKPPKQAPMQEGLVKLKSPKLAANENSLPADANLRLLCNLKAPLVINRIAMLGITHSTGTTKKNVAFFFLSGSVHVGSTGNPTLVWAFKFGWFHVFVLIL